MSALETVGRIGCIVVLFVAIIVSIQIGSAGWAAVLGILFGTALERFLMK